MDCYLQRHPLDIRKFEPKICPKCGKIFPETGDDEKNLKNIIVKNSFCGEKVKINNLTVEYDPDEKFEKFIDLKILLFCEYNSEEKFKKEYDMRVKVIKTMCKTCSKLSGSYCEVILQLRGDREKIINAFNKIDKKIVSKVEELKEGIDVYLISRDYGLSIVKSFADEGAILKFSSKLWGVKDGQRVYRGYILVRFSDIKINDRVKYKDKIYRVIKTGKFLTCESEGGKKKQIRMNMCKRA